MASFRSVPEMFLHRVTSTPDSDALYYPDDSEQWQTLRWADVGDRVRQIACGLRSQGLQPEERCAILCSTRHEWVLIDLGILCAAGATSTIYPSCTAEECEHIITDSAARFIFAESDEQVDKLSGIRESIPGVTRVITVDGRASDDGWVIRLDQLMEAGRAWMEENPGAYEAGVEAVQPDHLATLIYTSGTTGRSKGVELTHDCWVFEAEAMDRMGFLTPADKQFLWLPLSHSFGKVLEAAVIRLGIPTAIDGRIDRIVPNLAVVQPTFVAAVPRIFEKVYNKVVTGAKEGGALKWRIFTWSLGVGRKCSQLKQRGQRPTGALALQYAIANRLVFRKLSALFGGRMRFFISGSAPLSREIAEFFHAAGILILEGYGLTESSAASFVCRPDRFKFGTVGLGLPGVEVQIAEADGEILLKSRGIMRGYHNLPDKTAETLTGDGWLRTGDIGEIDADGFLKITDRKKDLIKTSGGKYVAPQELEGRLKTKSALISQVLVHGNRRNFCSALITLDEERAEKWANDRGRGARSAAALAEDPDMVAEIQTAIDALNKGLARYETIKRFAILPEDWTVESGLLTPSMKMKRKKVEETYADVLDGFYKGALQDGI